MCNVLKCIMNYCSKFDVYCMISFINKLNKNITSKYKQNILQNRALVVLLHFRERNSTFEKTKPSCMFYRWHFFCSLP